MDRRETTVNRLGLASLGGLISGFVLTLLALGAVVLIALHYRETPAHCGQGLQSLGPACCPKGQVLEQGRCSGAIESCPASMRRVDAPRPGCLLENRIVPFQPGKLELGPMDWEAEGSIAPRSVDIRAFSMDSLEVTVARWHACELANSCKKLTRGLDPGLPMTGVSPAMAERFCLFNGGRLPTSDEWQYVAAGSPTRRYPWGNTGLVCRRAAFGLVTGPCAEGAVGPTLVGSRPSGRTPEGLFDMSGNVAEWTHYQKGFVARGGSFRSSVARELKSWSGETRSKPGVDVGFRCAYDPSD